MIIEVPKQYGAVLFIVSCIGFLSAFQIGKVSAARKLAKITYPQYYAELSQTKSDPLAHKFNCAQRAHGNTLELQITIIPFILITGLKWPLLSSGLGLIWIAGRFVYTIGYLTGDPAKRSRGHFGTLANGILFLTSLYVSAEMAYKGLS